VTPLEKNSDAILSFKIPVAYVDVRVFAHATEDLDKVLTAARNILPPEQVDTIVFKKSGLTGHHGNPIVLLEARIKDKKTTKTTLEKIASSLSMLDKEQLGNDIAQHLEKGNLYLRLDKQSLFQGDFRLSPTDAVHLRIHFKKHTLEEILEACRNFGLLP
jgi:RNA binding exosome subunit